tara:strand:- start:663 stop:1064 length:402 start_codon:yes stop_codon:yes gene_type:complete
MKKQIEISNYIYIFIMIIIFGCSAAMGQGFINEGNFDDKIAKDIIAVEFWAGWNSANEFAELEKLKQCEKYRVDIGANSRLQTEFSVISVPTVIIFDNGVEKERFAANIMFQLEADKKTIQNSIDTIKLNKFQ